MAWVEELRGLDAEGEGVLEVYQPHLVSQDRREKLGLAGREGVERPLKRIDFRLGRPKGGGSGGGRYGGSSRGWGKGEWRGRGGRGRGGHRGGRSERGEKRGETYANGNGNGNGY